MHALAHGCRVVKAGKLDFGIQQRFPQRVVVHSEVGQDAREAASVKPQR